MQRKFITLIFCLFVGTLSAQDNKEKFLEEFTRIQQVYKGTDPLSFSIQYLYSTADDPTHYRDSIGGTFKLKGDNSWGTLGEAEYICNQDYRITLYKSTGSMLLDKRDDHEVLAFFKLDSLFANEKAFTLHSPKRGEVWMAFSDNSLCDSAHLSYDPDSYHLKKLVYQLKPRKEDGAEGNGKGLVQIIFSDYSTAPFDESLFAAEKYVQKKGKEYKPTPAFANYNLYLASSKLLN